MNDQTVGTAGNGGAWAIGAAAVGMPMVVMAQDGGEVPVSVPGAGTAEGTTGADGTPLGEGAGGGAPAGGPGGFMGLMIPLLFVMIIVMMIMSSMSARKQRKVVESMQAGLSRGDKVQTDSGMIGTVAEISDDEISIRVDETTKTQIRFARRAVARVLAESRDRLPDDGTVA